MRTAVIYNYLIEATIIAGIAILLMIPVRKFFRKQLGNKAICFAWLLVAIRLLCPLSLPNPLINEIVTPYNDQPMAIRPIAAQVKIRLSDALNDAAHRNLNRMVNEGVPVKEAFYKDGYRVFSQMSWDVINGRGPKIVMAVYAGGALAVAGWFILANVRFRRNLKKNRMAPLEGDLLTYYHDLCEREKAKPLPVYFVDPLSSACLVGVIHPYIALPLAANLDQAKQMLAHEICHYKAKDHIWTLITLLCCVIHWFNPLVWFAAAMSRMDRELLCDDRVTRGMDEDARKQYAGTLIQSITRRSIPGLPVLATGMSMTGRKLKTRVGSILRGGRSVKALAVSFTVLTSLLLICAFGTGAYGEVPDIWHVDNPDDEYYVYEEQQSWEEALASEYAVKTEEEAIEIAKGILSGPYYRVDLDSLNLAWKVGKETGPRGKQYYVVMGKNDKYPPHVQACIAVDGVSGCWSACNGFDPYYAEDVMGHYEAEENISDVLTQEQQEEIINYCYALTEHLEPGESNNYNDMNIICYIQVNDVIYIQVEAPFNANSGKTFILQIKPDIRVIDYYTGNG